MNNSGGIFIFNPKIILLVFAVLPPPNYFVIISAKNFSKFFSGVKRAMLK